MDGIASALKTIDEAIRKSQLGSAAPEGAGLHYLLDQLAVTTLGAPRSLFEQPKPVATTAPAHVEAHEPVKHEPAKPEARHDRR